MTIFWISVAAMSFIASGLMLWPIWKKSTLKPGVKQDQLNVVIFEDRLAELDTELATGALPKERYEQARNELRRDLLQNTGSVQEPAGAVGSGRWMAPLVGVLVPVIAIYIYLQLGSPELVDKPPVTAQGSPHQGTGEPQEAGDMNTMIQRLRERLRNNPEDVDNWMLLGRSYAMIQQFEPAAMAYGKAYDLAGEVPDIMAQYAETLALSNGGQFEGKPADLLKRAGEINPQSPRIMWLLGVVAIQQDNPTGALEIWNQLLALLPPDSNAAEMVKSGIQRISGAQAEVADAAAPSAVVTKEGSGSAGTIKLRVDISSELKVQAAPDDTVFIFARAVQGSRMPLAAVRHQVKELPLMITLDDSTSMAGQKLSTLDEVAVVARISKSASPMPQSGDLEGSTIAKTGDEDVVSLNIDSVRP